MKRLALVIVLAAATCAAQAQAIYRCGQNYSQNPCPDGKLIDSADQRTAAQRAGHLGHAIDLRPRRRHQQDDAETDRLGGQKARQQECYELDADRHPRGRALGGCHGRVTLASNR